MDKKYSIVDLLDSLDRDSSYASRKKLAKSLGFSKYSGTVEQNIKLLNIINSGEEDNITKSFKFVKEPAAPAAKPVATPAAKPAAPAAKPVATPAAKPAAPAAKPVATPAAKPAAPAAKPVAKEDKSYSDKDLKNKLNKLFSNLTAHDTYAKDFDARKLQSGIITDKRTNKTYVIQDGKIAKEFNVLTGKNVEGNKNDTDNDANEKRFKDENKNTPVGFYETGYNKNIYGRPGLNMEPIDAYGVPSPLATGLAYHTTYDPANREPLYDQAADKRAISYGCVNCKKADIDYLTKLFPGKDTALVIDSKNPKDLKFIENLKRKPRKYQDGGFGYKPPKITEDDIYLLEKMDRDARIAPSEATAVRSYYPTMPTEKAAPRPQGDPLGLASGILKGTNMSVGAIADFVNESNNRSAENKQYYSSLRDTEESDFIQNDIPLYTKFGGGFPRDKAMKILRDGKVNGRPLSKGQKKFFATMAFRKAMDGADLMESPDMWQIMMEGGDVEEMKEGGMPQRYKAMGFTKTDTPKRTPNASKSHAVVVKDGDSYKLIRFGQQGVSGSPKKDGESESYKNRRESFKARHAKNIAKGKTSAAYWADKVKWQEGGDVPEVMGLPDEMMDQAWIEAEAGEVYKQPNGQVLKISEDGDRHEEGGEYINNVEKVLEDTSTSRRDTRSKALAISPEVMKAMFGIDINKKLSHSEALEVMSTEIEKDTSKIKSKLTKVLKSLDKAPNNKYAQNSLEFNVKELQKFPSKEEIFDALFNHQESLKEEMNMKQAKYGIALPKAQDGLEVLYKKASAPGAKKTDILAFQKAFHADTRTYGYAEKLVNDRANITNYGKKMGYGKGHVGQNEDGLLGDTTRKYFDYFNQNVLNPPAAQNESDEYDMIGASTSADYDMQPITPEEPITPGVAPQPSQPSPTQYSDFNEPLRWTDIMAPAAAYLSADRIPAKYNPAEFKKVDPRLENVLPYLQQGQRDFNTVAGMTENNGAGQANLANVFAQKYAIDNQTRAAVNDRNLQRQGAADIYNAQVSDKQSVADQQSRAVFEQQQLMGIEAQRKQKLQSLDEILQRVNLNRKQNREGDMLMKLFPNFNSYGEFNGNNRYQSSTPSAGGASAATSQSRFTPVQVPMANGQTVQMLLDNMDGKVRPISNNKDMSNTRNARPIIGGRR
jgi:hypothetical protein